jgi:dihydroneopterin aldolase
MSNDTMSNNSFTRTIDFQQLCTEIAEHLAELDGEALADLANKVLSELGARLGVTAKEV